MKKNYETPTVEILAFATEDVIRTSGETARLFAETPEDRFEDAGA